MSRLTDLFSKKQSDILNIYFTAGYPKLDDTERIILALDKAGADVIELGMPYSDPMADGPTIQESGSQALKNGMKLAVLFDQLKDVRTKTQIPLVLMGYFNQVMQFGEEQFFAKCMEVGIDGLILPDLPLEVFAREYKDMYKKYSLDSIFLMSPQSGEQRIKRVDELSTGFIYMVADASITGKQGEITKKQIEYFENVDKMGLKNPRLIGFGISDHQGYTTACNYANGAIIGSAFIRQLKQNPSNERITDFIYGIKGHHLIA
ncbi:MAG: tryptophan synthase subunit alpha [Saprospiraceae bacterium]|nr:tryptophan synthase subunit alpha [Saprospiraceae bacterium]